MGLVRCVGRESAFRVRGEAISVEPNEQLKLLIYSHDTFGLGHLQSLPRHCSFARRPSQGHFRPDPVGLAHHRLLRFPHAGRLRPLSRRRQAQQRRVPLARPRHLDRGRHRHPRDHHPLQRGLVPPAPLPRRQGAAGPQGRGRAHAARCCSRQGTRLVLGLRDIMDDQEQLAEEWDRKAVIPALESVYDDIWVYGLREDLRPARRPRRLARGAQQDDLHGLPQEAAERIAPGRPGREPSREIHAGHDRRRRRRQRARRLGASAYEHDRTIPHPRRHGASARSCRPTSRHAFRARAKSSPTSHVRTFDAEVRAA